MKLEIDENDYQEDVYDKDGHKFMTNLPSYQKDAILATLETMKNEENVIGFGVHVHLGKNTGPCGGEVAIYLSNPHFDGNLSLFWNEFDKEFKKRKLR